MKRAEFFAGVKAFQAQQEKWAELEAKRAKATGKATAKAATATTALERALARNAAAVTA